MANSGGSRGPHPAAAAASRRPGESVFVGRERELAELEWGLAEALQGKGRLFLVAGEAGIGKSRLAEMVAARAVAKGAAVHWGYPWESDGAPPYWPWIQILRTLVAEGSAEKLRARISEAGLSYIAQIVPDLARKVPGATAPPTGTADPSLGAASERFRLFDAVTRFILNAAAEQPKMLVLDDLHWADASSLLLLRFLTREMKKTPLLIVGAYRDVDAGNDEQRAEILASFAREGTIIHLGGLSEPEVGRFVDAWNPGRTADDLVSAVYRTTGGNPFFLEGILRLLASEPSSFVPGGRTNLPVPVEVRDAVRQRLSPLSKELRELLTLAAVLGRQIDVAALAAVSGVQVEDVLQLLVEGRKVAILAETETATRWRFAHDLLREVLYEDLSPTRRMALHERVGRALQSFYGRGAEAHAAELASHFLSALPLAGTEKALEYGTLAVRQAMAAHAWEEAVRMLNRLLAALEAEPEGSERKRLELLLDLGDAIWHSEDAKRYSEVFAEAIVLARKRSLPTELARAVLGFVGSAPPAGEVDDAKVALLEEALAAVGETDPSLRGRLLVQLSWQTYFSEDRDRRQTAEEAVGVARRSGDPKLLAQALRRFHSSLMGSPEHLPERISAAAEILDVARRTANRELVLLAENVRVMNFLEAGEVASLDSEIAAYARDAALVHEPFHLWYSSCFLANRALMMGRWEDAERHCAEALSKGLVAQPENATASWGAHQFQLHYERGRVGSFLPLLRDHVDRFPNAYPMRGLMALAYADVGQVREAQTQFELLTPNSARRTEYMLPTLLASLSVLAAFLGEAVWAGRLYDRLLPFSGLNILLGPGILCWGSADRFLGLLAGTLSRWPEALRHFDAAMDMNRRLGAAPLVARTQYDYARMLLRRGDTGDVDRAAALLREAVAAARELDMARLREVAEETLGTLTTAAGDESGTNDAPGSFGVFRREGEFWTIGWGERVFRLRSTKGVAYLHKLILEPGRELHCLDVLGEESVDLGDAGERLDAGAKAAYGRRLEDLREELAEAESHHDSGRATKAREEIEILGQELSFAMGLGGRDRRASANVERARIRVTRAIRDAIARIAREDASLGQHLSTAIRTGGYCSYSPDPTSPVTWRS